MNRRVLLDTGVLGRICHPNTRAPLNAEVRAWFRRSLTAGLELIVPEIADYELRRKLLHIGSAKAIEHLDELVRTISYLPVSTPCMRRAAELWCKARVEGLPTAGPEGVDIDVILAAQAELAGAEVVTENVGHLSRFVTAAHWRDI